MTTIANVQDSQPRFTLTVQIPMSKDFLRHVQRIAMTNPNACPRWGKVVERRDDQGPTYLFDEHEWEGLQLRPPPHRIDLYTIQRGLAKIFDAKYQLSMATRQMVLRALFEQTINGQNGVLALLPSLCDQIVQLALYDQVVY